MIENKFRKNNTPQSIIDAAVRVLQLTEEEIKGFEENYVLDVSNGFFVSYGWNPIHGGKETAFVFRTPPINTMVVLEGDFRQEVLDCNLDMDKITDIPVKNQDKIIATTGGETRNELLDVYNNNPELKQLMDDLNEQTK